MKLLKCIKCTLTLSILSLVYIHLQMQIIDLAYQGKSKENQINNYSKNNEQIRYQIYSLKSAHNIGSKLLAQNDEMQFANENSIVQLVASQEIMDGELRYAENTGEKKKNSLISFLSLDFQKEARAQE